MKKLLFIVFLAVLGHTVIQARTQISGKGRWKTKVTTRVPESTPFDLYYEGSTLFIHANMNLENITIEVKDNFNKTIYLNTINIQANDEYVFTLGNIPFGRYSIEIKSGDNYIIGTFIL